MLPDNDTSAPTHSDNASESPMSILERRLAEIRAQQDPAHEPAAPPAETAAAPANNPPAAPLVPPAPGSPEASAATESVSSAPDAPEAAQPSAPAERALAHYGTTTPAADVPAATPAPEALPIPDFAAYEPAPAGVATSTPEELTGAPVPAAEVAQAPAEAPEAPLTTTLEAFPLHTAADIENAPMALASLPTSDNEGAKEAAAAAAEHTAEHAAEEEEEYVADAAALDFTSLDLPAQATHLLELLRRPDARQNRKQILDLNRQYEANVQAARTQPAIEGNEPADAAPAGHVELIKALQEFRESRARDAKNEDEQRAKNLAHKQYLLSQLRQLVESAETKDSSSRIKALQNDWKATGPVPQKDAQELWNSYHALLDIYYNNRGLFFEMKELDRRRNQEAKEALIARAEALPQQPSINKALQELRQLHEEWKHIGPVPNEQREPLWQRFLQASEQVHDRKKEFLTTRSTQENANLERKTALLERLRPFGEFQTERVNEWRSKTDELQKLKEEWDAAGLVPRDKAEALNKQFWGAYKGFFQRKNQFFKALDEEKNTNLKRKLELCEQAEAALQNPNWEEARETVIRLQKDWKLIGRVPEKQSDKVWNRFRTACDSFFDRRKEETRQREQQVQQLGQEQAATLDRIAAEVAAASAEQPGSLDGFRQYVSEWRAFSGARSNERAEERFQALMGKYLDTVPGLSYSDRSELLFGLQVERLKASPDAGQQLYKKEQALRREINELENDISTLRTNLEFFARSKNASQLRQEYQGRIDEAQLRIDALKKQLKTIRS
ncbi:DUF349 domain-containing protein [Hymenobacter weizhouensis]|uniref:DUF349 domain-containing protein n=1 Tax=Hymenobacter sp. YIM 151500-1 TaxID=2987689 RepID=UPI00222603FC|nr:DUF349 domain-containing protein [Hymenobacter sp. YIM 151500-1]UYZ64074.1 DUF349 domain-containing protein [Hymenobacter sp. YIM 151500-1]